MAEQTNERVPELTVDATKPVAENPHKGYVQTLTLSIFFGWLGVDRFYLDKIGTGILKLLTAGGFGIWVLIDITLALGGSMRQKHNDGVLYGTAQYKPFFMKTVVISAVVFMVFFVASTALSLVAFPWAINKAKTQTVCVTIDGTRQCKPLQEFTNQLQQLQGNPSASELLQNY